MVDCVDLLSNNHHAHAFGHAHGDIVDEEGNFFGHNLKNNQIGVYIFSELHNETGTVQDLPGGQKEEHINNQQPQADPRQTHYRRGTEDPQDSGKTYRKDQHLPQPRHLVYPQVQLAL